METTAEPRPKTYKIGKRTFTILFPSLLRPLNKNERQPLKNSIRKNGVVTPVVVDEEDGVIDGANRVEIASELGLANIPVAVRQLLGDEQKLELALALNDARRQLTPKDRREAQANLEKERAARIARVAEARKQGESTRAIAAREGVSQPQVVRDLKAAGDTPVSPGTTPEKVQGRDGKEYAARRTKAPAVTLPEELPDESYRDEEEEMVLAPPVTEEDAVEMDVDRDAEGFRMTIRTTGDEAKAILGDLLAPEGSPAWCLGMRNRITQILNDYHSSHERLQRCLETFRSLEGWKNLADNRGNRFLFYEDFCKARKPSGLGSEPDAIEAIIAQDIDLGTPLQRARRALSRLSPEELDVIRRELLGGKGTP